MAWLGNKRTNPPMQGKEIYVEKGRHPCTKPSHTNQKNSNDTASEHHLFSKLKMLHQTRSWISTSSQLHKVTVG